ncbi:MAG TPA: VOC family protein, partial [Acidobacteriota bacterium]|nr:VOC family protein [Acidobacteriota bacterium]
RAPLHPRSSNADKMFVLHYNYIRNMESKARPTSLGIRHVALRVRDLARMRDFYVEKLGFHIEWEPDPQNVYLTSGMDNLALHEEAGEIGHGSLDHIGILVQLPDEVDAWAFYLKAGGITLAREPRTHRDGARSFYFADPEGNMIQIIYHPPISGK